MQAFVGQAAIVLYLIFMTITLSKVCERRHCFTVVAYPFRIENYYFRLVRKRSRLSGPNFDLFDSYFIGLQVF